MMQAANALNGWLALLLAGLLEIAWALGLKYSDGLTRFWPSVTMIAAIALSFGLLAISLKSVEDRNSVASGRFRYRRVDGAESSSAIHAAVAQMSGLCQTTRAASAA
jgi:hypothetical protein